MNERLMKAKDKIIKELKDFTDVAVLGMSGGADSTLVACLCIEALGANHVISLHMPYSETDIKKFNANSVRIAKKLNMIYIKEINIKPIVDSYFIQTDHTTSLIVGNTRSRVRANLLYNWAGHLNNIPLKVKARVIGTGNLSEDFIGYDTKGGDALADIFPIGELYKREVYEMLDYYVSVGYIDEDMIDRVPSAGLWDDQTDEKELGYSYNDMEPHIRFMKTNYSMMNDIKLEEGSIADFVWKRHLANKHKHEAPKVISLSDL